MASKNARRRLRAEGIAAQQARAAQLAREQRQQTIIGALVVGTVVVMVAVIGLLIWHPWNRADNSDDLTLDQAYSQLQQVKVKPAAANKQGGITLSKNGVNQAVEGVPTVGIYMDFMCPGCGAFHRSTDSALNAMLDAGQVNIELHPMSFGDVWSADSYSTRAANMLLYIIDHDKNTNHILGFIANMYDEDFQPEENSGVKTSDSQMQQQAVKAGVSKKVAKAAVTDRYTPWLDAIDTYTPKRSELWNRSGTYKGQMTTPTITINGQYWNMTRARSTSGNTLEALLTSLGIDENKVGVAGQLPSIGSKGNPLY